MHPRNAGQPEPEPSAGFMAGRHWMRQGGRCTNRTRSVLAWVLRHAPQPSRTICCPNWCSAPVRQRILLLVLERPHESGSGRTDSKSRASHRALRKLPTRAAQPLKNWNVLTTNGNDHGSMAHRKALAAVALKPYWISNRHSCASPRRAAFHQRHRAFVQPNGASCQTWPLVIAALRRCAGTLISTSMRRSGSSWKP